jgi:hypothetical protein
MSERSVAGLRTPRESPFPSTCSTRRGGSSRWVGGSFCGLNAGRASNPTVTPIGAGGAMTLQLRPATTDDASAAAAVRPTPSPTTPGPAGPSPPLITPNG